MIYNDYSMSSYDKAYIVKTIKKMLDEVILAKSSTVKAKITNSMFEFMNTYENFYDFLKDYKKFRDTVIAKTYELLVDQNIKLCPELEPTLRRCQEMINNCTRDNEDYITSVIQGHIHNVKKHDTAQNKADTLNSMFNFLVTHDGIDTFLEKNEKFRNIVKEKIAELEPIVQTYSIFKSNLQKCQQMIYNIEGYPQEVSVSYGYCPQEANDSYGGCPQEVVMSYGCCQ